MIKGVIKFLLGQKNINRVRRVKSSLKAAKDTWNKFGSRQTEKSRYDVSLLISVHELEKALVIGNRSYLEAVKYDNLIERISGLIQEGLPPDDFTIAESAAIIKAVLDSLLGHEDIKSHFKSLITKYNIPLNFSGGMKTLSRLEIFAHNNFDFHGFISSRHSIRNFRDTIISREVIYDIVRDALYCPSACNRQPFKVYFSENESTVREIIKLGADSFVAHGIHDCLIVTCDRDLLTAGEMDDQEYINGGIFLGYLVISIHAHGLGSCLFQCTHTNPRQAKIKSEFGIKDSEIIVCCVGIGELEDEVNCTCSQRRPVDTIAISLDA